MFLQKYFKLYQLQAILSFIGYGFVSVLYLHFYKNNISLGELFLAEGLSAFVTVLLILLRKSFFSRRDMQIGFMVVGLSLFLLFLPFSKTVFFLYTVVRIAGTIIFYIPYNALHFQSIKKNTNLESMTLYWSVSIICSIFGPLLGMWIFSFFGLLSFVLFALFFILLGMYLSIFIPEKKIAYSFQDLRSHLIGYRMVNTLDGALHKVGPMLALFALIYIQTEFEFGGFLSFIAGVSLVGALVMAKSSDKKKKRMIYLVPLSIAAGFCTFAYSFANTFWIFLGVTIVLRILTVFIEPIRSNIILDTQNSSALNWVVRELYLNIGRTIFSVIAYILMVLNLPIVLFLFSALLHCAFPLLLYFKKIYKKG